MLLPEAPARGAQAASRRVVLGAATGAGAVTVVARAADGSSLQETIRGDRPRPRGRRAGAGRRPVSSASLPERTSVAGAVVTSARAGASVLPLTVPLRNGLVPQVRPGLP